MSKDGKYLLVNETGEYRVLRIGITSRNYGKMSVLIDNLPGFPDNISRAQTTSKGKALYWLGLVSPRNELIDSTSNKPLIRKIAQRMPARFRPKAQRYSHVLGITGKGEVIYNLQDPKAKFAFNTGALDVGDYLYISSLLEKNVAKISKKEVGVH